MAREKKEGGGVKKLGGCILPILSFGVETRDDGIKDGAKQKKGATWNLLFFGGLHVEHIQTDVNIHGSRKHFHL